MKTFLLTLAIIFYITCHAQITTTKVVQPAEPAHHYDSIENFLGYDMKQYIGQDVYLKGLPLSLRNDGYEGFVMDYRKNAAGANIYQCCTGVGSNYDSLAGKYFTVLDALTHIRPSADEGLFDTVYFFKLANKQNGDVLYWQYHPGNSKAFRFIVAGYFVKYKKAMTGKKFMLKGKNWFGENTPMLSIQTGLPVTGFEAGAVWQTVDVTVEEKNYTLSLVLENEAHEQITIPADDISNTRWAFDNNMVEAYKKALGTALWPLVLQGNVQKGMAKDACLLAWGKPVDITTLKSKDGKLLELWNYEHGKLYFADGVLFEWG